MAVEPVTLTRSVRPANVIGIALTGGDPFNPDVPDVARPETRRAKFNGQGRVFVFGTVEEKKDDTCSVAAEEIKLRPSITKVYPKGERASWKDLRSFVQSYLFSRQAKCGS